MSFGSPVTSSMSVELQAAADKGVVLVAAAGNSGPDAMTIGVPGNVPYVITVGAMSDNYTPSQPGDDFVTLLEQTDRDGREVRHGDGVCVRAAL